MGKAPKKVAKKRPAKKTTPSTAVTVRPGRPSAYQPEFSPQARRLCLLGATDKDLAEFFEVSVRTIYAWKLMEPEFLQALKEGKAQANANVADSLYQRAIGYEWDEAQPIKLKEVLYENGKRVKETERVEIVMVHRVIPPDPTSMIFWLKNRRPDLWRDRVEHTGADGDPIQHEVTHVVVTRRVIDGDD